MCLPIKLSRLIQKDILLLSFCSYVERKAFMKVFHLVVSKASPFASLQHFPTFCSSISVVLFQTFLGLTLFLVPWGLQSNACLAVAPSGLRSGWPIKMYSWFLVYLWSTQRPHQRLMLHMAEWYKYYHAMKWNKCGLLWFTMICLAGLKKKNTKNIRLVCALA